MRPGPVVGGSVRRIAFLRRLCLLFVLFAAAPGPCAVAAAERALVLNVDGVIGPAITGYVVDQIKAAAPQQVGLIILRMNTPGGLDS